MVSILARSLPKEAVSSQFDEAGAKVSIALEDDAKCACLRYQPAAAPGGRGREMKREGGGVEGGD